MISPSDFSNLPDEEDDAPADDSVLGAEGNDIDAVTDVEDLGSDNEKSNRRKSLNVAARDDEVLTDYEEVDVEMDVDAGEDDDFQLPSPTRQLVHIGKDGSSTSPLQRRRLSLQEFLEETMNLTDTEDVQFPTIEEAYSAIGSEGKDLILPSMDASIIEVRDREVSVKRSRGSVSPEINTDVEELPLGGKLAVRRPKGRSKSLSTKANVDEGHTDVEEIVINAEEAAKFSKGGLKVSHQQRLLNADGDSSRPQTEEENTELSMDEENNVTSPSGRLLVRKSITKRIGVGFTASDPGTESDDFLGSEDDDADDKSKRPGAYHYGHQSVVKIRHDHKCDRDTPEERLHQKDILCLSSDRRDSHTDVEEVRFSDDEIGNLGIGNQEQHAGFQASAASVAQYDKLHRSNSLASSTSSSDIAIKEEAFSLSLEQTDTHLRRLERLITSGEDTDVEDQFMSPTRPLDICSEESPITKLSPVEPLSKQIEEDISPPLEYAIGLTPDTAVKVGVSPTEEVYRLVKKDLRFESNVEESGVDETIQTYVERRQFWEHISSQETTVTTSTTSTVSHEAKRESPEKDMNVSSQLENMKQKFCEEESSGKGTFVESKFDKYQDDASETEDDDDMEIQKATLLAYENTGFVGVEAIDNTDLNLPSEDLERARSPFEVCRDDLERRPEVSDDLSTGGTQSELEFISHEKQENKWEYEHVSESNTSKSEQFGPSISSEEMGERREQAMDTSDDFIVSFDRQVETKSVYGAREVEAVDEMSFERVAQERISSHETEHQQTLSKKEEFRPPDYVEQSLSKEDSIPHSSFESSSTKPVKQDRKKVAFFLDDDEEDDEDDTKEVSVIETAEEDMSPTHEICISKEEVPDTVWEIAVETEPPSAVGESVQDIPIDQQVIVEKSEDESSGYQESFKSDESDPPEPCETLESEKPMSAEEARKIAHNIVEVIKDEVKKLSPSVMSSNKTFCDSIISDEMADKVAELSGDEREAELFRSVLAGKFTGKIRSIPSIEITDEELRSVDLSPVEKKMQILQEMSEKRHNYRVVSYDEHMRSSHEDETQDGSLHEMEETSNTYTEESEEKHKVSSMSSSYHVEDLTEFQGEESKSATVKETEAHSEECISSDELWKNKEETFSEEKQEQISSDVLAESVDPTGDIAASLSLKETKQLEEQPTRRKRSIVEELNMEKDRFQKEFIRDYEDKKRGFLIRDRESSETSSPLTEMSQSSASRVETSVKISSSDVTQSIVVSSKSSEREKIETHATDSSDLTKEKRSDVDSSSSGSKEELRYRKKITHVSSIESKKSAVDIESYSSSGESHYQSFEQTPSRPCSSDVEALTMGTTGSSEYDTAMSSQEPSYRSVTSQEYQTAVSSISSRDSMKSIDSESSGHLASVEVSSETSETLVPSALELEQDLETLPFDQEEICIPITEVRRTPSPQPPPTLVFTSPEVSIEKETPLEESLEQLELIEEEIPTAMKRSAEMTFYPEPSVLSDRGDEDILDREVKALNVSVEEISGTESLTTVIEDGKVDSESLDTSITSDLVSMPMSERGNVEGNDDVEKLDSVSKHVEAGGVESLLKGNDESIAVKKKDDYEFEASGEVSKEIPVSHRNIDLSDLSQLDKESTFGEPSEDPNNFSSSHDTAREKSCPDFTVMTEKHEVRSRSEHPVASRTVSETGAVRIREHMRHHSVEDHLCSSTGEDFVVVEKNEEETFTTDHFLLNSGTLADSEGVVTLEKEKHEYEETEKSVPQTFKVVKEPTKAYGMKETTEEGFVVISDKDSGSDNLDQSEVLSDDDPNFLDGQKYVISDEEIDPVTEDIEKQRAEDFVKEMEKRKKWIDEQFEGYEAGLDFDYDRDAELYQQRLEDIEEEREDTPDRKSTRSKSSFGSTPEEKKDNLKESLSSTPEYDVLAGRKYFARSSDQDDVSTSSLQEFETLEREMYLDSAKFGNVGSNDSLNALKTKTKKENGSDGSNGSFSSLNEFERLEKECVQAELIEIKAKEEEAMLSEIEEGHESQISESESCETLSDNGRDSDSDDYEQRMFEIDEIIRQAQSNVEKFAQDKNLQGLPLEEIVCGLGNIDLTESSLLDKTESIGGDSDSLEECQVPELELDIPGNSEDSAGIVTVVKCESSSSSASAILSSHHSKTESPEHLTTRQKTIEMTIGEMMEHSSDSLDMKLSSLSDPMVQSTDSLEAQVPSQSDMMKCSADSLELKKAITSGDDTMVCSVDSIELGHQVSSSSAAEQPKAAQQMEISTDSLEDFVTVDRDLRSISIESAEEESRKTDTDSCKGLVYLSSGSSGREGDLSSSGKDDFAEIHNLSRDIMSSFESLDPTSSNATHATLQLDNESLMSASLTSADSVTLVSSTDTLDLCGEGRLSATPIEAEFMARHSMSGELACDMGFYFESSDLLGVSDPRRQASSLSLENIIPETLGDCITRRDDGAKAMLPDKPLQAMSTCVETQSLSYDSKSSAQEGEYCDEDVGLWVSSSIDPTHTSVKTVTFTPNIPDPSVPSESSSSRLAFDSGTCSLAHSSHSEDCYCGADSDSTQQSRITPGASVTTIQRIVTSEVVQPDGTVIRSIVEDSTVEEEDSELKKSMQDALNQFMKSE